MKPFPSVESLSLFQAMTMLDQANALVAEASNPETHRTDQMLPELQLLMLEFAAKTLRQNILQHFGPTPIGGKPDEPEISVARPR